MKPSSRISFLAVALAAAVTVASGAALAQAPAPSAPRVRPKLKGRAHSLKIDSSPQQAAVYWDAGGPASAPRDFGIAGYTPLTVKVPRGAVKIVVELRGFKLIEREIDVQKSQTMTFTLERASMPGKLDLRSSGDGSALGADVAIDGVPRGTLPNTFELTAGRHKLDVTKAGFKPFSDWVDIGEDERRTRDVFLERSAAAGGSLLVTSDAGGDVYVDGERRDAAPAMIANIAAGDHVVEVRKDGQPPWRQSVTIQPGQQTKVMANVAPAAAPSQQTGAIRIIASEQDVLVYLDGEAKGRAPQEIQGLRPGQHIVEGRKTKFKAKEEVVKLTPGELLLVRLQMEAAPEDKPKGMLRVQSAVPEAEVFLDGASLGRAPIDRNDLDPGKHYLIVHKEGYVDFKREVMVLEGKPTVVSAELRSVGTLKFLSSPDGAQVLIDGEPVAGKTPNQKDDVAVGEHVVEMRLPGYYDVKQTIKVEGAKDRIVQADLQKIPTGPTADQIAKRKKGMSSFGGKAVPPKSFTADLGIGYPYFFVGRLTTGIVDAKPVTVDGGIEFRTFFQETDLAAQSRVQFVDAGPFAVAARGDFGGGFGPNGRNSVFFDLGPVASLSFVEIVTFSAFARLSYWSDQLCPTSGDISRGVKPRQVCQDGTWQMFFDKNPEDNRFGGFRVFTGVSLEVAINKYLSTFLIFEGLPPPQYDGRKAFTDDYNSVQLKEDLLFYGTAGITLKL